MILFPNLKMFTFSKDIINRSNCSIVLQYLKLINKLNSDRRVFILENKYARYKTVV